MEAEESDHVIKSDDSEQSQQLQSQHGQARPLSQSLGVPKRKPVPGTQEPDLKEVAVTNDQVHEPIQQKGTENTNGNGAPRRFVLPALSLAVLDRVRLGALDKYLPKEQRKRRYAIAGIFTGLLAALLALVIGLAVGLTVGKKGVQNLPLPTSNGGPYTGDLTYYAPGLGACGITSSSSDSICAVSHIIFDAAQSGSDPNANPLCGLKIRLRRNDESVDVTVVDRCVGCAATDIDTTTSVFGELAEIAQGRVTVEWAWLESSPVNVTSVSK